VRFNGAGAPVEGFASASEEHSAIIREKLRFDLTLGSVWWLFVVVLIRANEVAV
jgi:hypothetical protein